MSHQRISRLELAPAADRMPLASRCHWLSFPSRRALYGQAQSMSETVIPSCWHALDQRMQSKTECNSLANRAHHHLPCQLRHLDANREQVTGVVPTATTARIWSLRQRFLLKPSPTQQLLKFLGDLRRPHSKAQKSSDPAYTTGPRTAVKTRQSAWSRRSSETAATRYTANPSASPCGLRQLSAVRDEALVVDTACRCAQLPNKSIKPFTNWDCA